MEQFLRTVFKNSFDIRVDNASPCLSDSESLDRRTVHKHVLSVHNLHIHIVYIKRRVLRVLTIHTYCTSSADSGVLYYLNDIACPIDHSLRSTHTAQSSAPHCSFCGSIPDWLALPLIRHQQQMISLLSFPSIERMSRGTKAHHYIERKQERGEGR